jgi:tetratricopeptide (TPR) repeat protein
LAANGSKSDPLLSAFISHAKADEKKADAIAKALEAKGFKCWIAPRDVKPGRSYGDEIIRGIGSARSFVLVLSKASNDSAFVAREVERAVSKKKPIFAVRLAGVQPGPALELFISGTQWIDAFPGRLAAHVDRLAAMLADEEGRDLPAPGDARPAPRNLPKWAMPLGAAAAVLLVLGAGLAFWPGQQAPQSAEDPGSMLTNPVWLPEKERERQEQIAAAEAQQQIAATKAQEAAAAKASGDTEMVAGGMPAPDDRSKSAASLGLAGRDADYQSCETGTGYDALAACDRAIAGGKFTGRNLSYLYSDRGFLRMQERDLERALTDLDEAARIDPSNFYAFWNRGALWAAKGDYGRAQEDLTTALTLNPDKDSKAKIEEALNAVTAGVKSAVENQPEDKSVITQPTWNSQGEVAGSAASNYPADAAMPASPAEIYPAAPPTETTPMPAEPYMDSVPDRH